MLLAPFARFAGNHLMTSQALGAAAHNTAANHPGHARILVAFWLSFANLQATPTPLHCTTGAASEQSLGGSLQPRTCSAGASAAAAACTGAATAAAAACTGAATAAAAATAVCCAATDARSPASTAAGADAGTGAGWASPPRWRRRTRVQGPTSGTVRNVQVTHAQDVWNARPL